MDEYLEGDGGHRADAANLLEGELAGEYNLAEAGLLEELHLGGRTVVHLGTGVEGDGGQVKLGEAQVLDDEGVCSGVVELPGEAARILQLRVGEDGIQGDIDARAEAVGVVAEGTDVVE